MREYKSTCNSNKELGLASRLHGVLYVILLSILIYVSWELPFFFSKNIIIASRIYHFLEILILTRINHLNWSID